MQNNSIITKLIVSIFYYNETFGDLPKGLFSGIIVQNVIRKKRGTSYGKEDRRF